VFGRTYLRRIQGCAQILTVLACAIGPLLLAETLLHIGSYDLIFDGLGIAVVLLGIAFVTRSAAVATDRGSRPSTGSGRDEASS